MQHISLSDRLSREIVNTIRTEKLQPGDALESARALAARFEVTVPTIREALRRLEATDIIELRHGSGTYVGHAVDRTFILNPYLAEASLDSALELAEARLVLEPSLAAEAARHRSPEALARLEATLGNALLEEPDPTAPTFHSALAAATGNAVLSDMLTTLLSIRKREREAIRQVYSDRKRDHAEHVAIHQAIADGDAELASTLTEAHLAEICAALRAEIRRNP